MFSAEAEHEFAVAMFVERQAYVHKFQVAVAAFFVTLAFVKVRTNIQRRAIATAALDESVTS